MNDRCIFLTGASGFVGGALLSKLPAEQLRLFGRKDLDVAGVPFFKGEMIKGAKFLEALGNAKIVIHCAARVHIMDDSACDSLIEYRAINTEGTLSLARQSAQAGVKRFIFLSTIKVNGESTSHRSPFTAFDKHSPEDDYGISKSEAEEQLLALGSETGMEIVIIRPPLVYGESVKANFASLMKFVGKGFPLPFRFIKHNKRSLVSVYNLVDLIKVCIDHPRAVNQVFLVSDDDDLSTSQMVALMAKVQGKINFSLPVPVWCFKLAAAILKKEAVVERLVGSLQLDIEHTKKTLDWVPPYSVEHGFRLTAKK
ncbi:UDP-glucose 4-epimerase family protein [Eionea flava]